MALSVGRLGHPYFMEAAHALAETDRNTHRELLELAEDLLPASGVAAMEFLKVTPRVLDRLQVEDLARWQAAGRMILDASIDGGEAFFRLESSKGEEIIHDLSSRVDLDGIGELIRLYCKALTGADVAVRSVEELTSKGVGWVSGSSPTTEGTSIFLPPVVEDYASKEENFAVYKVFATHQAAWLEFGSFQFRYHSEGPVLGRRARDQRARDAAPSRAVTDMERFFDLFEERQLAHDLFTIVEDTRIDWIVKREYAGVRKALTRLQQDAADRRRPVEEMPARQAMVENLVRASLDEPGRIGWPFQFLSLLREPLRILEQLRHAEATVEDSAEATAQLYDWIMRIPNVQMDVPDWAEMPDEMPQEVEAADEFSPKMGGEGEASSMPFIPHGDPEPYDSPEPVDFRGDFKPELVQLLMTLKDQAGGADSPPAPLSPEQLKELLEKSVEININEMQDGDLSETSGMFMENLMKEVQAAVEQQLDAESGAIEGGAAGGEDTSEALAELPAAFYYDEWDFRANDYKPRWCRVLETHLEFGETTFFEETLREHGALVAATRRQFELLKPEMFRRMKRLPDGEDYDLDAVIEWIVQRKAHAVTDTKVYTRRNKVQREVAVAMLLDMSASTDEEITKHQVRARTDDDQFDDDPRQYLTWWAQRRAQEARFPSKRIIDLEKEAMVLLIEALETIGDTYGVYGFSGYGRDNVEFYVIKDMDEAFGDPVKQRVDKISPVRSTRMGPAIRHCIYKLRKTSAKVKILFLVSDGRPQDHGYGRDRTEKEYAIHDTKMALTEARREGMTPFCLTVDRGGHDYLKQMCEDMGYEVVADIESLPRRLPALYRRLTR